MARIAQFVLLACAIAWTIWIGAAAAAPGLAPWLSIPAAFGPAVGALLVTWWGEGRAAVSALIGRMLIWRVGLRWYLFALTYMALVKLAAALIHRLITGAWPAFGALHPMIMVLGILISTPVQAGEELGWRGFMLPRLADRIGAFPASLVVGVVWAAWHLPMFFLASGDMVGQSFWVFLMSVTALSVAFAWLYANTGGSLLMTMLLHAAVNNTTGIVPAALSGAPADVFGLHTSLIGWLTVLLLALPAVYFAVTMPRIPPADDAKRPQLR